MEIQSAIKFIADKLGLDDYETPNGSVLPGWFFCLGNVVLAIGTEQDDDADLVMFAAYVKAEMDKRGWLFNARCNIDLDNVLTFIRDHRIVAPVVCTTEHYYDPTDPISEAHAIINAAAEALRMEE